MAVFNSAGGRNSTTVASLSLCVSEDFGQDKEVLTLLPEEAAGVLQVQIFMCMC